MGNSLTHKQSARVVVDPSAHLGKRSDEYNQQVSTLAEKEFTVVQLECRSDLYASAPASDRAVISSLAYSNYVEMQRDASRHHDGAKAASGGDDDESELTLLTKVRYAPFGPVIQTEPVSKQRFGADNRSVTNVAVGGRANFANCFIRTASAQARCGSSNEPVNVGDGVYMATFLFTCDDDYATFPEPPSANRIFNFLIVDNDYSMVPKKPAVQLAFDNSTANKVTKPDKALKFILAQCLDDADKACKLCQTLCCAFDNPGHQIRNAARCDDLWVHVSCVGITCTGVVIESPIPNTLCEHPLKVLNGMINKNAEMSTTHPVVVQMSS